MEEPFKDIALRIDAAIVAQDEPCLSQLIAECDTHLKEASGTDQVVLYYFKANAFSGLVSAKYDSAYAWSWQQSEAIQELLNLRLAVSHDAFENLNPVRRCQIRTNLANRLNSLGRSVEAFEQWDRAIATIPEFAMALGNRAYGLNSLSRLLYDPNHQAILLHKASEDFERALAPDAFWDNGEDENARAAFHSRREEIEPYLDQVGYRRDIDLDDYETGKTAKEQEYRQWCLKERLFLNSLNDALDKKIAATDFLHLPSHVYAISEEPRFPMYYNHMKQEYVSARFRLYNAIELCGYHLSDHAVALFDTADAGEFGHHIEELKASFRAAYSLFDKIGMFLNDYFNVGLKPRDATFRRVWSQTVCGGLEELRAPFQDQKNWPLRGLYFLSKDLFDSNFTDVAEPDAQELARIRNYAEHRFLTLQHYRAGVESNDYRLAIPTDQFIDRTFRVLRMARAALIYLSMAMFSEEEQRKTQNKDKLSIPMVGPLPVARIWHIEAE